METIKMFCAIALGLVFLSANSEGKDPKVTCAYFGQFISDPYDCKGYYYCNEDLVPEHHQCPGDSLWDSVQMNCFPPPVICAGDATAPPTQPPTTAPATQYSCTFPSEIVPYLYDCDSFFICDTSLTFGTYYKCDSGYYYDPAYGNCNYASRVQCSAGIRPSPFPTAIPSAGSIPTAAVIASCYAPGIFVPDPYDCQAWWKCNAASYPEKFFCPPQTLFDHYTPMKCVQDALARCT